MEDMKAIQTKHECAGHEKCICTRCRNDSADCCFRCSREGSTKDICPIKECEKFEEEFEA